MLKKLFGSAFAVFVKAEFCCSIMAKIYPKKRIPSKQNALHIDSQL
jgi:hypothetical protein